MALLAGEQSSGGQILDTDGRLIVVGPGGVAIGGGGGGAGGTEYVEGTVNAAPTGGVVLWKDVGNALVAVSAAKPLPVSGPLTDAQLRAAAVPVSGTFWQATQPVSGTVTANVGTGTQPVSGTVALDAASLTALETISVANFPATQPVSGTVGLAAGANNIGDVDVLSLPALPAGANNIGDVDVLTQPHVGDHDVAATLPTAQIGGRANSEKAPDAEPAAVAAGDRVRAWHGLRGEYITRERRIPTYSVVYRAAAVNTTGGLTFTHTANVDKQWATLHHAATAAKLIRIHRIAVVIAANSVAGVLDIDVRRITTAPATGNPSVAPKAHNSLNPATEAVALALPGTAGTVDNDATSYSATQINLGIMAAITAIGANQGMMELLNQGDLGDSAQSIELRPGVLEGVAVILRSSGTPAIRGYVRIVYTEETP